MRRVLRFRPLFLFVLSAAILHSVVTAQDECAALVTQALNTLAETCTNLAAGEICYAHDSIVAVPSGDLGQVVNMSQGGRTAFSDVVVLRTLTVDAASQRWGIAALRLPINEPENNPYAVMLGDTTLNVVSANPLEYLPTTTAPACGGAPSMLVIANASPGSFELTLNTSALRFTDAVVVLRWPTANSLTAAVVSGTLEVIGGDTTAQAGETLAAVTDNEGTVIYWSSARGMSDEERADGAVGTAAITALTTGAGEPVIILPTEEAEAPEATVTPGDDSAILATPSPGGTDNTGSTGNAGSTGNSCGTHLVVRGENLYRLSLRYGTTVDTLMRLNNLVNRDRIFAGQLLLVSCNTPTPTLPVGTPSEACGGTHLVVRGDTLAKIAQHYGTTVTAIATANNIINADLIRTGQQLTIPCPS